MALQFYTDLPMLKISKLISAPNLEHLELEFPSINNVAHLQLFVRVAPRRHRKPFKLTLVASKMPNCCNRSPRSLPLDWYNLEQGFGPQDYTSRDCMEAVLHQPLLRESDKHRRIYCNQAYTAAAKAQTFRLAAAPQPCNFKLFRSEEWLCADCEDYTEQRRIDAGWYDSPGEEGHSDSYCDCDSANSECFSDSDNDESSPGDSEDED